MMTGENPISPADQYWLEALTLAAQLKEHLEYLDELGPQEIAADIMPPAAPVRQAVTGQPAPAKQAPAKAQAPARTPAPARTASVAAAGHFSENAASLEDLEAGTQTCQGCGLAAPAGQKAFGWGSPQPLLVLVTRAPRPDEAGLKALPGPEGELLKALVENGLKVPFDRCYIAPLAKCPADDLAPGEAKACHSILQRQLQLLKPKLILAFGQLAAQTLTGQNRPLGILKRGTQTIEGLPEAYLRLTVDLEQMLLSQEIKKEAWNSDLKILMPYLAKFL